MYEVKIACIIPSGGGGGEPRDKTETAIQIKRYKANKLTYFHDGIVSGFSGLLPQNDSI